MNGCGYALVAKRREGAAQGYRRFFCRNCGRQFNECGGGVREPELLTKAGVPSSVS